MHAQRPFGINETHGMLAQPTAKIHACSDGRDWTSLFASVQQELPFKGVFRSCRDYLLVLHRDGPVHLESLNDQHIGRRVVTAGSIHLIAPGSEFGIDLAGPVETVHVYVRRSVVEDVALDMVDGNPSRIHIPSTIVHDDSVLRALVEASALALEDDSMATPIFVDYLSRAIAGQLVRAYSTATLRGSVRSPANVGFSSALTAAIEFMVANIDRAISLADIADAARSSPSRIARTFRTELGMPTHRYLINMRVNKAKGLLEESSMPIAEIALECGFTHQEHLTRLFQKYFSTTPGVYRRSLRNQSCDPGALGDRA